MAYDVVALGELLVDFTPAGQSQQGNPCFEANPGGAPCNVLAMLNKLGHSTAFIGKVGTDMHGRRLASVVAQAGIDITGLLQDPNFDTTLAFVALNEEGDRDFSFFRKHGADAMLTKQEVNASLIQQAKIFHFGSLSLTNEPVREATQYAVEVAQQAGCLISFDPNLRIPLWENLQLAKQQILWGCAQCQILKLAKEEMEFITGQQTMQQGANYLFAAYPALQLLFITDGKNGAAAFSREAAHSCPAYMQVATIDTTGAGDTFMGCSLHYILRHSLQNLQSLQPQQLCDLLRFANAAAALVTTKKGAICSMPAKEAVLEILDIWE